MTKSEKLFERAVKRIPGGVQSGACIWRYRRSTEIY